jgi:NDP-sugar pyrophosphorylase family protein
MNDIFSCLDTFVLMAGNGTRFKNSKYDYTIKPLVKIHGKTILEWTLSSLPKELYENKFINFAIRSEHIEKYDLINYLHSITPLVDYKIFDKLTRGNLDTAYQCINSQAFIGEHPVLFLDSDNLYGGNEFCNFISSINKEFFAVVNIFEPMDNSTKWCFADVNDQNRVRKIYEKPQSYLDVLGWKSMIGSFYFSSISMFRKLAEKILKTQQPIKNEYYMSMVIDEYLKNEIPVFAYKSNYMIPLGDPESCQQFELGYQDLSDISIDKNYFLKKLYDSLKVPYIENGKLIHDKTTK